MSGSLCRNLTTEPPAVRTTWPSEFESCRVFLIYPQKILFSRTLFTEEFPDGRKIFFVTPVPKQSFDQTEPGNWRPVANLSPVSKVFERCLANWIRKYLNDHHKLSKHQFAYREKLSTELLTLLLTQQLTDFITAQLPVDDIFWIVAKRSIELTIKVCLIRSQGSEFPPMWLV